MIQHAMVIEPETDTRSITRRRGLALLAAATGGALSTPLRGMTVSDVAAWEVTGVPDRVSALERFRRAVDGDAIRRLAEDYLDASPEPADAEWLVAKVLAEAEPEDDVRDYMRRRVASDYEALRTHNFDGWMVSRTEARLLAVLALTA
jgi:hypothetical protein